MYQVLSFCANVDKDIKELLEFSLFRSRALDRTPPPQACCSATGRERLFLYSRQKQGRAGVNLRRTLVFFLHFVVEFLLLSDIALRA